MGIPQGNANDGKLLGDDRFLRRIAYLYYEDGQTQDAIAEMEFCSRQTIGKALQRAKDRGFIRISIVPEERTGYLRNLSRDLRLRLGLDDLILVPGQNLETGGAAHDILTAITSTAAEYLDQLLTDSDILAVSGGRHVMRQVVTHLKPTKLLPNLIVVPTIGFVRPQTSLGDSNLVSYDIAVAYGAKHFWLPLPAIVETQAQLEQSRSLPVVRDVLKTIEQATVIMTGLWLPNANEKLIEAGILSRQQVELLRSCHPVVDINHWAFDASGMCINQQFDPPPCYLTGLEIPHLKEKVRAGSTKVILVAGANRAYVPSILAALKAGIANILVTDHVTAELLMQSGEKLR
ncbi:sugar-binding transcriptional regulator [Ktedonosporobacter rubrisoli]|nr:sugar-binding domain-containing protein [Ktedonosporobacter rubrisoli]